VASGSIPKAFIETLLQRADIVPVISQRVSLKKAGTTYKACCPFHDEKTPSFNVNPTKQFYHCFGCGASGDALKFLMEYDGLSFVEAVETLAAQYGMEVPREKISPAQKKQQQERQQQAQDFYSLMHLAAKFYRAQLRDHPQSDQAKAYLKQRGLNAEIAKEFVIGFAPEGWDNLIKAYEMQPQLAEKLVELGMLVQKEDGKVYDRFRGRIMFPIRDGRGRVIAFGGRVFGDGQPKYLNSPETPIFHKSNVLYGLYEMRQSRIKVENILVVEGYMDVVSLAQFDIRNSVATLGTAFTPEHVQLLFRQVNEIVFCFDGDQAGLKAAWKAAELVLPHMEKDRSVRFLFLQDGEDPDSTVRKIGKEAFKQQVDSALSLSEFIRTGIKNNLGGEIASAESRQRFVALAEPYILQAQGLYQYLLVEMVADQVMLPAWRLEKQLGIRTGYAQGHQKPKVNRLQAANVKVVSKPLKIATILMKKTEWVTIVDEGFVASLKGVEDRDLRFLSGVIYGLKHEVNPLDEFLMQHGFSDELQRALSYDVPLEEEICAREFMALMEQVLSDLMKSRLQNQSLDQDSLQALSSFLKQRHNKK
jgi:DNA primase